MKHIFLFTVICALAPGHASASGPGTLAPQHPPQAGSADPLESARFRANPFTGVCENVALLNAKDYRENKEYWDQAIQQCGVSIQVLPDSGFFSAMIGRLGAQEDQSRSREFLQKVGERTLQNIDFNNGVTEIYQHCAKGAEGREWFAEKKAAAKAMEATQPERARAALEFYDEGKCEDRLAKLKSMIDTDGATMRVQREMMRRTAGLGSMTAAAMRTLFRTDLPGEKVELSDKEKAKVEELTAEMDARVTKELMQEAEAGVQRMKEIKAKIKAEHPDYVMHQFSDPSVPAWVVDWYNKGGGRGTPEQPRVAQIMFDQAVARRKSREEFTKFFQGYSEVLGRTRILAYLGQKNPDNAEIAKGAEMLLKNGQAERRDTEKLIVAQKIDDGSGNFRDPTDQEHARQMMKLMRQGPVVRELLQEDPSFCRTAAGIASFQSSRDGAMTVGLVAGSIGVSVLSGGVLAAAGMSAGAAALTISAASGAAYLGNDFLNYRKAERQAFNFVHSDPEQDGGREVADVGTFQEARNAFAINAAITTVLLGAQAGGQGVSAYRNQFQKHMGENETKYLQEAIKRLRGQGLSEHDAKMTMRNLASQDKAVAKAALDRVSQAMGVDNEEVLTMAKIVEKKLYQPGTKYMFDDYSARLLELKKSDPEARRAIFQRAQAILDQISPGDVSPEKSRDALRVALAASDFGVKDPDAVRQLATNIKQWDQGLYGLARVFDQAKENLKLADIQKLAPDLRQEAAFRQALGQLGVKSNDVVKQMVSCALHAGGK